MNMEDGGNETPPEQTQARRLCGRFLQDRSKIDPDLDDGGVWGVQWLALDAPGACGRHRVVAAVVESKGSNRMRVSLRMAAWRRRAWRKGGG